MGGLLREVGQLAGATLHGRERLVVAGRGPQPQPRPDLVRTPTSRAGPVPQPRARRTARSLNPAPGRGNTADRLGQQTGIGRIRHVRWDHRGVGPHPRRAQQPRLRSLGQQHLVQPPTAVAPQRVVSFINVVGCGTTPSSGIRQNRRHMIESLTSRHNDS